MNIVIVFGNDHTNNVGVIQSLGKAGFKSIGLLFGLKSDFVVTLLNKGKRPSVLAKLHELVQAAAELPGKIRHKEQERGL